MIEVEFIKTIAEATSRFVIASNKHVGGGLSSVEMLSCLYFGGGRRFAPEFRRNETHDNVVLSKGHAPGAYYFCLWLLGYFENISLQDLLEYGSIDSKIPRMPIRNSTFGIDMSTGSLGQGLSFGAGLALADVKRNRPAHTYVILGDAECTEGQIWEAAATIAKLGILNLTVLLDINGFGSGITVPRTGWVEKWQAFGWETVEVDGHNIPEILGALKCKPTTSPRIILFSTRKGNGLQSELENTNKVHNKIDAAVSLASEQTLKAATEIALEGIKNIGLRLVETRAQCSEQELPKRPVIEIDDSRKSDIGEICHPKKFLGECKNLFDEGNGVLIFCPDSIGNSGLESMLNKYGAFSAKCRKSQLIECNISEQDTASMAGGVSAGGYRSIVITMEGFVWRMLDSIRQSICFPQLSVVIIGTSGGLGDELGPMVQSDSCYAALTSMFGLTCLEAADSNAAKCLLASSLNQQLPTYIRIPHERTPVLATLSDYGKRDLSMGYWVLEETQRPDIVIVASGIMVSYALSATAVLREKFALKVRVVEIFSVTRFSKLSQAQLRSILPDEIPSLSVHNAPSDILGKFLSRSSSALGVNNYGGYGKDIDKLYERAGLTVQNILKISLELIR